MVNLTPAEIRTCYPNPSTLVPLSQSLLITEITFRPANLQLQKGKKVYRFHMDANCFKVVASSSMESNDDRTFHWYGERSASIRSKRTMCGKIRYERY